MITINHTVNLVAEMDENNSTTKQLLALPSGEQVYMLEKVNMRKHYIHASIILLIIFLIYLFWD